MNDTVKKLENILGRSLSCLEAYTIMNLLDTFPPEVLIEAMELSKDKKNPLQYFKKILYNTQHPLEYKQKKEEEPQELTGSEWLEEFKKIV